MLSLLGGSVETGAPAPRDPEPAPEPALDTADPALKTTTASQDSEGEQPEPSRQTEPQNPASTPAPIPVEIPRAVSISHSESQTPTTTASQSSSQSASQSGLQPAARSAVPQRLLILDTETTALSPADGSCIEVGAVLFHVPSRAVLSQVSFLLPCNANPAEHVNGIAADWTRLEQPWQAGLQCFLAMAAAADAVLAHNAAFDRQWFGHGELPALERPWICSMEEIRWPAEKHLRSNPSVRDLALAYGVPVWAAHRALTDCIYLAQVFERCSDLDTLLAAAQEPRHLYRANLSYAERHRAKEAGFRWNDPVPGAWSRRLSESEVQALGFPVQQVELDREERPAGSGAITGSSQPTRRTLPRSA
nr:3'-5' exonuclease [Synechococcus sp. CBW1107]